MARRDKRMVASQASRPRSKWPMSLTTHSMTTCLLVPGMATALVCWFRSATKTDVLITQRLQGRAHQSGTSAHPSPDPSCSDLAPRCIELAKAGDCDSNPKCACHEIPESLGLHSAAVRPIQFALADMYHNCASSCHACDRTAWCKWDALDPKPLGVPAGSMPVLIERATSPSFRAYQPSVLSENPLVLQLDAFLDKDEVAALVELSATLSWKLSKVEATGAKGTGQSHQRTAHRDSQSAFCYPECFRSNAVAPLLERGRALTRLPKEHSEMQFVQYDVGQYYNDHSDFLQGSEHFVAGPRTVVLRPNIPLPSTPPWYPIAQPAD